MLDKTRSVRFPAGARWDCRACGACCRGYEFGPVAPEIIRGLEELDIEAHWAPAKEHGWAERRVDTQGNEGWFLRKIDDHCVFLRDDNLCAVHAIFGAEAKPSFCREFPFHLIEDPTGLVAIVRSDCGGFHESFVDGAPIEEHLDEILALPRTIPLQKFAPAEVPVLPGLSVPLEEWVTWEARLLEALEAEVVDPEQGVARMRAVVAEFAGRPAPAPDTQKGRLALRAVLTGARMVMNRVLDTDQDAATPEQLEFAQDMSANIDRALERLDDPLPPLADDARAYLHLVLRSFVLAKQFGASGGLAEGLGGFLLGVTTARMLATPGPDGISAAALSSELTAWNRFAVNRTIVWLLGKARPALADIYRHGV